MKKVISIFVLLVFATSLVSAQEFSESQRIAVAINANQYSNTEGTEATLTMPLQKESASFVAMSASWIREEYTERKESIMVRFRIVGSEWEDWRQIVLDVHQEENSDTKYGNLMFLEQDYNEYQVQHQSEEKGCSVTSLQLHFFNPGKSTEYTPIHKNIQSRESCECLTPDYQDRNDWCPGGNCPEISDPLITDVSHLIVHHTASPNTSNDWPATVRSFWDYHVNTRGWSDIGYNWLIDPTGVLYQGRGDNVQGAHFCGTNGKTMGIAVIGTFTDVGPTDEAKAALVELLSWKSCKKDINPLNQKFHPSSGKNLFQISGHRDGCATSCPGDTFYPQLPSIREGVVEYIDTVCSSVATEDLILSEGLVIYPNPVRDELHAIVRSISSDVAVFYLQDMASRTMLTGSADSKDSDSCEFRLDMNVVPVGMYFLLVRQGDRVYRRRVVKL